MLKDATSLIVKAYDDYLLYIKNGVSDPDSWFEKRHKQFNIRLSGMVTRFQQDIDSS